MKRRERHTHRFEEKQSWRDTAGKRWVQFECECGMLKRERGEQ